MAIRYRVKCPNCGEVMDVDMPGPCKKCNAPISLNKDGCIQLYRMGNFMGCAGGFGLYINGTPYGYIANKQSLRIPLDAGTYTLHVAVGLSRNCNDPVIEIKPGSRALHCYKVRMKPGVWTNDFVVEPARFEDMPAD